MGAGLSQPGLLSRLLSYAPRQGRLALEDFITEIFAFLLDREEVLSQAFVELFTTDQLSINPGRVLTQQNREHCRFDLMVGGPVEEAPALIVENKVWSGFSGDTSISRKEDEEALGHQLTRYLQVTSGLSTFVASVTVAPDLYEPPDHLSDRWLQNRTWEDVLKLLAEQCSAVSDPVSRFMIDEFSALLRAQGIVMSKVDASVFRANPGRASLAGLMNEAVREAAGSRGGLWSFGAASSGLEYLSVSMQRANEDCIGLGFWDACGELALLVWPSWLNAHPVGIEDVDGELTSDPVKFWTFPAKTIASQPLEDAASRHDQRQYLVELLTGLAERVESGLTSIPDSGR